ncbi:Hypothetical predicted protein [Cloeon dipterum]|uniref:Sulfatase N-terminal domain-containing protein n=1 Tax=Cloeon dipterum TaxID=197152 RepID=A0A8S1D189_9INSE|nr:Hypothetical predicted protein [Cloeon dipterum]
MTPHTSVAGIDPRVILISRVGVDDLRPALGCFNDSDAVTPNLDSLARASTIFTRSYSQQALCAPSRNSFLTSRRPDSLYLYDTHSYWRVTAGNYTTIPQHLKNHGYTTASFGKIFHPGIASNYNDDSPWSWSEPPFHPSTLKYKNAKVCLDDSGALGKNLVCPVDPELQPEGTLPDLQTTDAASKYLNTYNNSSPFFIAVGYHKPHIPLKFPREFLKFHNLDKISHPHPKLWPEKVSFVSWNPWTDLRERDDVEKLNLTFPFQPMPENFAQVIRQHYFAAVTYIDRQIGELIQTLKSLRLMENTIIVVVGDHGWSLGEHSEWAKYSNFEKSVRVPLIIYDPDLSHRADNRENAGSFVRDDLVELVDIFPTLNDLVALPKMPACKKVDFSPLCTEGRSLAPLLYSQERVEHWRTAAFSQYPRPNDFPQTNSDQPRLRDVKFMGYTARTDKLRFTWWIRFQDLTPNWNTTEGEELYDHTIDPAEEFNLAYRPEFKNVKDSLKDLIKRQFSR